jgi:Protein of unknown function (DUF4085)
MIFFTRELYEGYQDGSGWQRRALRQWDRRQEIYTRYFDVIAPLLPASLRRLHVEGLHDGRIRVASLQDHELVLRIDANNALSGFRGRQVHLRFRGVRGRPKIGKLVGQWWLYHEAHLSSRARFSLHVFFDRSDLEVEADELIIKLLPNRRAKPT